MRFSPFFLFLCKKSSNFASQNLNESMKKILLILVLGLTMGVMAQQKAGFQENSTQEEKVYEVVDQMPAFPGGQTALFEYLKQNMKYPAEALNDGIEGRVVCKFVVEKDGSISGVKVLRSSGNESLDTEAVRVLSEMPNWTPGEQGGKKVRVNYSVPLIFRLPN